MYVHMHTCICADHQARKGIMKGEEEILRGEGKRETRKQNGDYFQGWQRTNHGKHRHRGGQWGRETN